MAVAVVRAPLPPSRPSQERIAQIDAFWDSFVERSKHAGCGDIRKDDYYR